MHPGRLSIMPHLLAKVTMRPWRKFRFPFRYRDFSDPKYDEEKRLWFAPKTQKEDKSRPCRGLKMAYLLITDLNIILCLVLVLQPLIILWRSNNILFKPTLSLPKHHDTGRQSPEPQNHSIPLILHQTCANETIPEIWAASQQSCQGTYSHFQYMVCPTKRNPLSSPPLADQTHYLAMDRQQSSGISCRRVPMVSQNMGQLPTPDPTCGFHPLLHSIPLRRTLPRHGYPMSRGPAC